MRLVSCSVIIIRRVSFCVLVSETGRPRREEN